MTPNRPSQPLKCPVCAVRFRGSLICSRCGTDLTSLMRIAARAWSARSACANALRSGNLDAAIAQGGRARALHDVHGSAGPGD